jgi:hypothetical protein
MTTADINSSINNLIGTFATVNTGDSNPIPDNLVCIDTSNNRIGVNTIDPLYGIHVVGRNDDSHDDAGTVASKRLIVSTDSNLIVSTDSNTQNSKTVVIFDNLPTISHGLVSGQLYNDSGSGILKIKIIP